MQPTPGRPHEEIRARIGVATLVPHVHFGVLISVFKPRIAVEIMLTALAGMAVTQGVTLSWRQVTVLSLSVLCAAGAAGAYNQLVERDIDARMLRTRRRPFASGELSATPVWFFSIAALLLAAIWLAAVELNLATALYVFLGAFTYGIVYTHLLKRRTTLNIVVGGLAGSFAALAGSAAVTTTLTPAAWCFALALFFWTPPHFWSLALYNKQDYLAANVPMLPTRIGDRATSTIVLAHTLVVTALTLLPPMWMLGSTYVACAAIGGGYFIYTSTRLASAPTRKNALRNFFASLCQLSLLLLGAIANAIVNGTLVR